MTALFLGNQPLRLDPAAQVGKGGEADVFLFGGRAVKVFKSPDHPDLVGQPTEQAAARRRIEEHQTKLLAFPVNLPDRVVVPEELVRDASGRILGYAMRLVSGADVLFRFGERRFRDAGVSDDRVVRILVDLHRTVDRVHRAGVTIGDFNDLNVLVSGSEAHLIDADSAQFGSFLARTFTAKFVDPTLCDSTLSSPKLVKPHSAASDWYAYLVALTHVLLFAGPYGGVYRPTDAARRVPHDARPLKRITFFDPEVRYPRPARHFKILSDPLLDVLNRAFVHDERVPPSIDLIEGLRFTTCVNCGTVHARDRCPDCTAMPAVAVKHVVTGKVKAEKTFVTDGTILYATVQRGTLRFVYHEGTAYFRDGGLRVTDGTLDPQLCFRICGDQTLLARGRACVVVGPRGIDRVTVDCVGTTPVLDANADHAFFAQGGMIWRSGVLGYDYLERVGDVLANQTHFWVGETHGFGFYRASDVSRFFTFRAAYPGINDSFTLSPIRGQLVDQTCVLGTDRAWFVTATHEAGQVIHRARAVCYDGTLLASAETTAGDGSWLGTIGGKCAAGGALLCPTDDGVVRVEVVGARMEETRRFEGTARFVDSGSRLFAERSGLAMVGSNDAWRLTID